MANRNIVDSKVGSDSLQPEIVPIPGRLCIRVVIPTLNEESQISRTLESLMGQKGPLEIVAVDGGSTDGTLEVLRKHEIPVLSTAACRGAQLRAGAAWSRGSGPPPDALLFLHADTQLPQGALASVREMLSDSRVIGGKFPLRFDVAHPLLRVIGLLSKCRHPLCSYGDQGLFVRWNAYQKIGGFASIPLFEDVVFYKKLIAEGRVGVVPKALTTSARKFVQDGVARRLLKNTYLRVLFFLGVSPTKLAARYYSDS